MRTIRTIAPHHSVLRMFAIYSKPSDLASGFAVRGWSITSSGTCVADEEPAGSGLVDLDAARALVPDGMVNIGRTDEDDATIVEVWV